jgi:methylated-DNA-[protein]-cysteine S-methyltransferase
MVQELFYAVFQTSSGWMGILGSSAGVRRITLPLPSEKEVIMSLGSDISGVVPSADTFKDLIERLQSYFSGGRTDFPDKLDCRGATPFQHRVWEATRRIPYGQTRSYGWVARQLSKPGAARAVGQALSRNPFPIIVPCHRVLASNGGLGGFSGGLETKIFLLGLEKAK